MKIADVIRFAHEHGNGNVYQGWSNKEIATHLTFHANGGTLMVTESDGEITSFSTYKQIKDFSGDIDTVFWNHTDREGVMSTFTSWSQGMACLPRTCSTSLNNQTQTLTS